MLVIKAILIDEINYLVKIQDQSVADQKNLYFTVASLEVIKVWDGCNGFLLNIWWGECVFRLHVWCVWCSDEEEDEFDAEYLHNLSMRLG